MASQGGAYNKGMGGVGIAGRNRKYLNIINPASITARDTLSFMADYSIYENNSYFRQNNLKGAANTFNINDIAFSFPIYKSSAMMVGISPYSNTGFYYGSYSEDQDLVGEVGNFAQQATYLGSIYQIYAAGAVTFWNRLSLGAQWIHYFGSITKDYTVTFTNSTYNGIDSYYYMRLNGDAAKFGIQYEQPIGSAILCIGATYKTTASVNGDVEYTRSSSGDVTTDNVLISDERNISEYTEKLKFASEFGVGASLRFGEQLRFETDFMCSDWTNSGISSSTFGFSSTSANGTFSTTKSHSLRAGAEWIPNANDVRYYLKRCSYRAGAYHNKEYYQLDGNQVTTTGLTIGATFPIFRLSNGLSVAIDLGQRGSLKNNMIRERFVNFTIGLNTHDIWFQKTRYN